MTGHLYVGITTPQTSDLEVTSATHDLSTVTAVSWQVTKPGGEVATWAASIISATATSLVSRHVHAAGDVPTKGKYTVRAMLTFPGGDVPAVPTVADVTR